MRQLTSCCLLLATLFICGNTSAQKKRSATPHAKGEDIYKHYVGTIGTKKVMIDLVYGFQGASNYGGSYLYYNDEPGAIHFVIGEPETFDHIEQMQATLFPAQMAFEEDPFGSPNSSKLEFHFTGNKLSGTWYSADKKQSQPLSLTEDYANAYQLDFWYAADTMRTKDSHGQIFRAESILMSVTPGEQVSKEDAAFINKSLLRFANEDHASAKKWSGYPAASAKKFFKAFEHAKENLPADFAIKKEVPYPRSFEASVILIPVYNTDGFLVFEKSGYHTDLSGKFISDSASYLCLDVRNKRPLTFDDMLNIDAGSLSSLLETAFRKRYKLPPDSKLHYFLKDDKMPVTHNVALASKGLVFVYSNAVLADPKNSPAFDQIHVFIPYSELAAYLTPGFKKRLGV